ncbi:MAG TPA: RHS repeat-associated core domain-containing protein [Solirubrobacteraceae bacterium]
MQHRDVGNHGRRRRRRAPFIASLAGLACAAVALTPSSLSAGAAAPAQRVDAAAKIRSEIPGLRTRTSRTYVTEDGRQLARLYARPVNYRDARGRWQAIDNRLVDGRDARYAWRNAANSYDLDLPAAIEDAPVRFAARGAWLSFALRGASARGAASDATARYAGALDGVDVAYAAQDTGVKETLTVREASAPTTFRFDVAASAGLTPREHASGGIEFTDRDGDVALSVAAPVMYAAGDPADASTDLDYAIERAGSGWELTLRADAGWVRRKLEEGPVVVDPTLTIGSLTATESAARECVYMKNTNGNTSWCVGPQIVAETIGDGAVRRPMIKFDLTSVPKGVSILHAKLNLKNGANPGIVKAYPLTRSNWTTSANWWKYDGSNTWTASGGDYDPVAVSSNSSVPGNTLATRFYLTEMVEAWHHGLEPNNGLILIANTGQQAAWPSSYDSSVGDRPTLDVVYEQHMGTQAQHTFERQRLSDRMAVAVNVQNGNLVLKAQDAVVAGTAMDLQLGRFYNSAHGHGFLDPGRSWRMSNEINLGLLPDGSPLIAGWEGQHVSFIRKVDAQGNESFLTPPGTNATLTKESSQFRLRFNRTGESLFFPLAGGGVTRHEDKNQNGINFAYSGAKMTSATDTQGRVTTFDFQGGDTVRKMTDSGGREYLYSYTNGNLTQYTDPAGGVTKYAYDVNNRMTDVTDPKNVVTKIAYDTSGRVTSIKRDYRATTGAFAAETKFKYDGHTTMDPCTNPTGTLPVDAIVGKTVVTDPRNNTTTYCYDWLGRVRKTRDGRGNDRAASYTSNSDVDEYTDGVGSTAPLTSLTWSTDGNNNLLGGQSPEGASWTAAYNNPNQTHPYYPSSATDEQGNQTTIAYDTAGNPTQLNNQGQTGVETTINWNTSPKGTIDSIVDGENHTTDYSYDSAGNLTSIAPPSPLGQTKITYESPNSLGRIATLEEGVVGGTAQHSESYTYDALGRLNTITYSDNSSIDYDYDLNGNLVKLTEPTGVTVYEYDNLNRLTKEILPLPLGANDYTYDAAGNLLTVTDSGGTTSYDYNAVNLNTKVTQPGPHVTNLVYHAQRNFRTQTQYPNGVTVFATPDSANRVDVIEAKQGTTSLVKRDYHYKDAAGTDRATLQHETDLAGRKTTYTYDSLNRLDVAEEKDSGGTLLSKWDYGYDKAGNRTSQTVNNTSTTTYAYNAANQLTSLTPPGGSAQTFTYDNVGNELTNGNGRTLEYNVRDQTTGITPTSGGIKTILSYSGASQDDVTLEGSTTVQNNVLGVGIAGGTTPTYYTRDEKGSLLGQRSGTTRQYAVQDRLGSVIGLTNASGTLSKSYRYDPYGNTTSTGGGGAESRFRYAQGWLSDGGLYHFGARYYDPSVGRWTQRDPLDQTGDLAEGNLYAYVGDDPVNATDPEGRFLSRIMYCLAGAAGANATPGVPIPSRVIIRSVTGCIAGASANDNGPRRGLPWEDIICQWGDPMPRCRDEDTMG